MELLAFGAQPVGDEAGEFVAFFGFAFHEVEGGKDEGERDGDGPGGVRTRPKHGGGDGDNAEGEEGFGDQADVAGQQNEGRAEDCGAQIPRRADDETDAACAGDHAGGVGVDDEAFDGAEGEEGGERVASFVEEGDHEAQGVQKPVGEGDKPEDSGHG